MKKNIKKNREEKQRTSRVYGGVSVQPPPKIKRRGKDMENSVSIGWFCFSEVFWERAKTLVHVEGE